ncbi:hypothetical protein ACJIZ3_010749 [Penstemon smallii]|uniref:Uncharacterized protein n=1 Tax=Penstemon smallii TaxID=265156 RepID=A0ABD3UHB4_9LAMI
MPSKRLRESYGQKEDEDLFNQYEVLMAGAQEYVNSFDSKREVEKIAQDKSMKSKCEDHKEKLVKHEALMVEIQKYINSFNKASIGKSKAENVKEICVLDDVSIGKENVKIRAMNGVDWKNPLRFIYTSRIIYPDWFHPIESIGCNCTNGCSDSHKCPCVLKNGGEIPFNERGAIVRAKLLVHECGPLCKCPPTCMNRVSQRGPQCQLEIFKTKSRGWGLRSRSSISSGDFICEYIGELLQDKEAEQRIGQDEYLFDISNDSFAIDAAKYGNIGRFINHSCSPNLYAQKVLYDHNDKRMPHIMFFATKNIPTLREITYDYNYKIGRVCDVNGNIKTKECHCGSRKCIGRLY